MAPEIEAGSAAGGDAMAGQEQWRAEGLLFENCNCQLLCRAHLSYRNPCDHERCLFHWAVHIDGGAYGDLPLDGLNAFLVGDTPRLMASGDWTEAIYIDERASSAQRRALEAIFRGDAGGPWAVLAEFVGRWLETRFVAIEFRDEGRRKRMHITDILETSVEAIRSADRAGVARLANVHNQIHATDQVLATGDTRFTDQGLVLDTKATHAVYSRFSWEGP
ncbi:MAG: DUF1326 domain-containing protein [Proteobacteria bacterium]|nr:DUF1326 domain-containing protein [Pseudomonadota bacterium]